MALLLSSRLTVRPRALPPIRFPASRSPTSANIRLYRSYSIRSLQLTRPTFCSARWIPAATYRRIKVETLDTTSLIANRLTLSTYLLDLIWRRRGRRFANRSVDRRTPTCVGTRARIAKVERYSGIRQPLLRLLVLVAARGLAAG